MPVSAKANDERQQQRWRTKTEIKANGDRLVGYGWIGCWGTNQTLGGTRRQLPSGDNTHSPRQPIVAGGQTAREGGRGKVMVPVSHNKGR